MRNRQKPRGFMKRLISIGFPSDALQQTERISVCNVLIFSGEPRNKRHGKESQLPESIQQNS